MPTDLSAQHARLREELARLISGGGPGTAPAEAGAGDKSVGPPLGGAAVVPPAPEQVERALVAPKPHATRVPGRAYQLQRFASDDPLEDAARELSALMPMPFAEAQRWTDEVMAHYHYGRGEYPRGLDRDLFHLIVFLTQPARIPEMMTRMDWIIGQLEGLRVETALDYGAGGGKDCLILAALGYRVTYADLLSPQTLLCTRRFALRGRSVEVVDVRDLGERRFDLINCMDVIEHVYDVEEVVADLFARLPHGGHLVAYPSFYNSWNGDHVEKNCGYRPYFLEMLAGIGLRLVARSGEVYHLVRERAQFGSVSAERAAARLELYRFSEKLSFAAAARAMSAVDARYDEETVSQMIDNFAIWRLSRHRLAELGGR